MCAQTTLPSSQRLKIAPGPKGLPVVGSLLDLRRQSILPFYVNIWREFGDVTRVQIGPVSILQFVRPEHVHHVLVKNQANYAKGFSHDKLRVPLGHGLLTAEGDLWRRQRRLMGPTFTPRAVTQFADIMGQETRTMLQRWEARPAGQPLAINREMMRLAMSVISRSMFTLDIGEDFAAAGESITFILEFASKSFTRLIDLPPWVPSSLNRKLSQALKVLDEFLYGIIEERRKQPPGDDLLSQLMQARDPETGEMMNDTQLRDEVLIIFFAGHETTASLLTWTWYLLSQHLEVEARFHDELAATLGGRSPTLDDLPQLTYTDQIMDETLRLYSPVSIMARDAVAADEIDGYPIPAGSMVTLTPYVTHRHPEFWERPDEFYPEHFAPEKVEARPRYAYYPFGAGSRVCLGKHFAVQEAALVLGEVAQRYQLRLVPGLDIQSEWSGTLRPNQDLLMTLHAR